MKCLMNCLHIVTYQSLLKLMSLCECGSSDRLLSCGSMLSLHETWNHKVWSCQCSVNHQPARMTTGQSHECILNSHLCVYSCLCSCSCSCMCTGRCMRMPTCMYIYMSLNRVCTDSCMRNCALTACVCAWTWVGSRPCAFRGQGGDPAQLAISIWDLGHGTPAG